MDNDIVDSGGIEVIIQNDMDKTAPRCVHGMRSFLLMFYHCSVSNKIKL